uniref:Uncharacterized protein n=1 Tax=Haptolina brevifila TaxID=156173 RepID=A0A7S2BQM0_9EUKA
MQNEELLLKTCARYIDSIKPNDKVLEGNLPKRCSQQPGQCTLTIELHACRGGHGHLDNDSAPAESTHSRVRRPRFFARAGRCAAPGDALEAAMTGASTLRPAVVAAEL